jgi:hypothetical protein
MRKLNGAQKPPRMVDTVNQEHLLSGNNEDQHRNGNTTPELDFIGKRWLEFQSA